MDIRRVDLALLCQQAADSALAVIRLWWPVAAYRDPKVCNFFEPFGKPLRHVNPDHVWVNSGDGGGGETGYNVDARIELFWEAQGGCIVYEGQDKHIMSTVNLRINADLSAFDFASAWCVLVESYVSALQTSFIRQEALHLSTCLRRSEQAIQMFPPTMHAQGAVTRVRAVKVPKGKIGAYAPSNGAAGCGQTWAGWDVAFVDGSRCTQGRASLWAMGFGVGMVIAGMSPPPYQSQTDNP